MSVNYSQKKKTVESTENNSENIQNPNEIITKDNEQENEEKISKSSKIMENNNQDQVQTRQININISRIESKENNINKDNTNIR